MILTLLRIGLLNMRRDPVAQALTFLLPIVFFSIFALVFGGSGGRTPPIALAVLDEDRSHVSRRIVDALAREPALRLDARSAPTEAGTLDEGAAERMVRNGDVSTVLVIPAGFGAAFAAAGGAGQGPAVHLLADPSNPVAPQVVQGLLQKVVLTTRGLTPLGVAVSVVDVLPRGGGDRSLISFYAAGIGVMFLLFSMVSGAGGALLDEAEAGTLERLLSTNMGMTGLLAGKWLFLTLTGVAQLTVMFIWGALVFDLPLAAHVPGFLVMTTVTAAAAAALGLALAALARTRAQLSGFSTILILTMSALGGSMFPRFLMSEGMQRLGLVTFNAWALDGYLKVFWRDAPLTALWPQLAVLTALAILFLGVARVLARRWEFAA